MNAFDILNRDPAIPVVVHAPHGGAWIPEDERARFLLDDADLAEELRSMTDHGTDQLAEAAVDMGAAVFVNRLSRLVVDPERFPDGREQMEAVGMGFAYTSTAGGAVLRRLNDSDRARLKSRWFDPYAASLSKLVDEVRSRFRRCVIIDLHSYPSVPLPYELHCEAPRPEVCVGTDRFHTPEWLAGLVENKCEGMRLSHARNTPFAGCYVPLSRFGRDPAVLSVMIEVRRDVYLDEAQALPCAGAARVARLVSTVAGQVGEAASWLPVPEDDLTPRPFTAEEFEDCLSAVHRMRHAVYGRFARRRDDAFLVQLAAELVSRRMSLVAVSKCLYEGARLVRGTPARRRPYFNIFFGVR